MPPPPPPEMPPSRRPDPVMSPPPHRVLLFFLASRSSPLDSITVIAAAVVDVPYIIYSYGTLDCFLNDVRRKNSHRDRIDSWDSNSSFPV